MFKYLSLFAFIAIIWSKNYNIMGTGLELNNIQDFEIIIENLSNDAIALGLTTNHFEYIIINTLTENGTTSNTKKSSQKLYIDIEINNEKIGIEATRGLSYSILLSFKRPIQYTTNSKSYTKIVNTWTLKKNFLVMPENLLSVKKIISNELIKLLDNFSSALLRANNLK